MDALIDHQHQVDEVITRGLRRLITPELSVVFYDLTTIGVEGQSELANDLRHYGLSKEGLIARQWLLGVVQTTAGLPLYHRVLAGNCAETTSLQATVQTILKRYPQVHQVIVIADRGLLSLNVTTHPCQGKPCLKGTAKKSLMRYVKACPTSTKAHYAQNLMRSKSSLSC